jgi:hypothetical protein
MTTYTVFRIIHASQALDVEVDDEGMSREEIFQAIDDAVDDHPDSGVSLCHQCAYEIDLGDVGDEVEILRDGQTFWSEGQSRQ